MSTEIVTTTVLIVQGKRHTLSILCIDLINYVAPGLFSIWDFRVYQDCSWDFLLATSEDFKSCLVPTIWVSSEVSEE